MDSQYSQSSSGSKNEFNLDGHYSVLNKFEDPKIIGKGGFGAVFKVKDKNSHAVYAVKYAKIEEQKYRCREAMMLKQLLKNGPHSNIVNYYNHWIDSVVDEYLPTSSESSQSESSNELLLPKTFSMNEHLMDVDEQDLLAADAEKKEHEDNDLVEGEVGMDLEFLNTGSFNPLGQTMEFLYIQLEYCPGGMLRFKVQYSFLL